MAGFFVARFVLSYKHPVVLNISRYLAAVMMAGGIVTNAGPVEVADFSIVPKNGKKQVFNDLVTAAALVLSCNEASNGAVFAGKTTSVSRPYNKYDADMARDLRREAVEGQTIFTAPVMP